MDIKKTKMIQGLFVVLVMMHHLAQKTSASWVPAKVRQPGLEIFLPIGYLLVSFFFFSSGYGLTKSRKLKENYFSGFLIRRLNPILMTFLITNFIYMWIRFLYGTVYLPLNPYSWFVYAIMVMYAGFYFVYRKDIKYPELWMGIVILAYSIYCYVTMTGDWWINSPPVFLVGILVAENEEKIQAFVGKKKKLYAVCLFVIFLICFIVTERSTDVYNLIRFINFGRDFSYYWINIPCIILQAVAGTCFSLLIYVLLPDINPPQKVGKVLGFFGAMTLEFYLIHGLFVQFFGHHFFDDDTKPACYIRFIPLYVLVVFILSTVSAFVLKKATALISDLYLQIRMFRKVFVDILGIGAVVAVGFISFTCVYSAFRHNLSKELEPKLYEFRDKNITLVDVGGKKVSTLLEGHGKYTVVILGSTDDPCPTMDYRPLTERLLSKDIRDTEKQLFRTIIIDYPGKGFSEDTDRERTLDFYTETIHETLKALGVKDKVVLVGDQASGMYAFDYINKYPEDVLAYAGFNPYFPNLARHYMEGNFKNEAEYAWYMRRIPQYEGMFQRVLCATGYIKFQSPVYKYLFYGSGLGEHYDIMEEMYNRRYLKPAHVNEAMHLYENTKSLKGFKMPEDLPAEFLLADDIRDNDYYQINWWKEYNKLITNTDLQKVSIIEGSPYEVYGNASIFAKKVENLMETIEY